MRINFFSLTLSVIVVFMAGCASSTRLDVIELSGGRAVVTTADVRTVTHTRVENGSRPGRVLPEYVTCAEPSPDVAKAVSSSFDLAASLAAKGLPSGVDPSASIAMSRALAEGLAQLGEPLAMIQLLRDGLYRACEAYANGAISDITYAVLLSRYDDTMITMLLGEFAAGGFGRSLATIGTGAEEQSKASLDLSQRQAERQQASAALTKAKASEEAIKKELTVKPAAEGELKPKLAEAEKEVAAATDNLIQKAEAETKSAAQVASVSAAGSVGAKADSAIVESLGNMQRKYIENLHYDALEIACISAMDRGTWSQELSKASSALAAAQQAHANGPSDATLKKIAAEARQASDLAAGSGITPLGVYCMTDLLPKVQQHKTELLKTVLQRAWEEKRYAEDHASVQRGLERVKEYIRTNRDLLELVAPAKPPKE